MRYDLTGNRTLDQARDDALKMIDLAAKEAQGRNVPPIPGQELIYQSKRDEAARYMQAGYPTPCSGETYPWITQESAITGRTTVEIAMAILGRAAQSDAVRTQIEMTRVAAKTAVTAAATLAAVAKARIAGIQQLEKL